MLTTAYLWHPAGDARQYEATGSRIAFHDRWNLAEKHTILLKQPPLSDTLQMMIDVLSDEQKGRWLNSLETAATNHSKYEGH
jgi:hypothetical protein